MRPNRVRVMKIASATIVSGATRNTSTSRDTTRIESVGRQVRSNGSGKVEPAAASGNESRATSRSCATPMVAISMTRRGDANSRRTTVSSTSAPASALVATASANASQ
jgi:hypothetical protein